jgi:RNA-dependent RNA polymerase
MTDGCGFISKSLLLDLRCRFEWDDFPTAIQCRLGGAKVIYPLELKVDSGFLTSSQGMLMLPGHDDPDTPRAWLRPSQIKIHYPLELPLDPALLVVNILRSSHLKTPGRLAAETIVNLAENGVCHRAFTDLLRAGLEERVAGLTTWEGRDAMLQLWHNVSRHGGVMMARRAREASGEARAKGYGERGLDAEDVEADDEDDLQQLDTALRQRSSAWWADQVSGCPSTLEETVMVLLDSGFTPQNCAVLRDKLKQVVTTSIRNYVLKYRIEVPMSCTAFLVPGKLLQSRRD